MKISRTVREAIKTVVFLLVVALIVIAYVIYPMTKTKTTMSRVDVEEYNADSLGVNDPTVFVEAGLTADTFRVESDGLTTLACLYLTSDNLPADSVRGTAFLLHADGDSRDDLLDLASLLVDSNFAVVAIDQRAAGYSTGNYRGEGREEADDLDAILSFLDLRAMLKHPAVVVGFALGGDACLLAAQDDERINASVVVDPYVTTMRMQNVLRKQHGVYWFPLYRTVMSFWYGIRSGYAAPYRKTENIKPVACPTLLMVDTASVREKEFVRLIEVSDSTLLQVTTTPTEREQLLDQIAAFLTRP
ncbi:MAG: alpha/beta hydrolase [candidate division Zixibacteria bacterium]|nr:alpha/beta hydrolase [candidate division Zixibacteria bacterium]